MCSSRRSWSGKLTRRHLGKLYLLTGKYAEALDHFSDEPGWQAVTYARMGRLDLARSLPPPSDEILAAMFWAAAGDATRAFELLDRS